MMGLLFPERVLDLSCKTQILNKKTAASYEAGRLFILKSD